MGSRTSVFRVLRARTLARGVVGSSVVLRRVVRLGLFGAGVKSSPSSSSIGTIWQFSPSESSTTRFLRDAVLLEGRAGDNEAIVGD